MGTRPDDRMVPVELVDDDAAAGASPRTAAPVGSWSGDGDDAPGSPHGRFHGPLVRWAVAGVVLSALAVVSVATTRGATDEQAAPGLLDTPLREVWAAAADEVLAVHEGVVVVQSTGTREPRVRALDEVSGREVWSVPLGTRGAAESCVPGVTGEPAVVWCWRLPRWDPAHVAGEQAISPDAIVAFDAATGEQVVEREVGTSTAGWAVDGEDLLLAFPEPEAVRVERVSPDGWRTVWTTTLAMAPPSPGLRHDAWVEFVEGLAVVHGPTTAVLDVADGRVLASWTASPQEETVLDGAEVVVTPQGFAAWSSAADGTRLPQAVWHDRAGRPTSEFAGELAEPPDGDGSVPEVLLVTPDEGRTLLALAADGGAELWRMPLSDGHVVARQDGAVVVATADDVTSYETLTGIERWTRPVDGLHPELAAVSDGGTLVVTAVRDRVWTALAYRLVDGGLLWSATVPGAGELSLIPYPPRMETVQGTPVVWVGRTVVWVAD